jgi:TolB protein
MKQKRKNLTMLITMIYSFICFASFANQTPKGVFDNNTDIGQPKLSGQSVYNSDTDEYTLKGAGYNIWFDRDEFQFLWKKVSGDFILQARLKFKGTGVVAHRKIGIMLRDSLTDRSSHINGVIHGDGLTSLQFRSQVIKRKKSGRLLLLQQLCNLNEKGIGLSFRQQLKVNLSSPLKHRM